MENIIKKIIEQCRITDIVIISDYKESIMKLNFTIKSEQNK